MNCPSCNNIDLLMSERQGIEIDYCPKCRGVWLDRGELDKFIQQSERHTANHSESSPRQHSINIDTHADRKYDRYLRDDDEEERGYSQRGKKKESFWGNLFDFD